MNLTIKQAVELIYRGKSNLIHAAAACDVHPDTLKQLLLERVNEKPRFDPIQLSLLLQ